MNAFKFVCYDETKNSFKGRHKSLNHRVCVINSSKKCSGSDRKWLYGVGAVAGQENQDDLWGLPLGLDLLALLLCALASGHGPSPLCKIWGEETHV